MSVLINNIFKLVIIITLFSACKSRKPLPDTPDITIPELRITTPTINGLYNSEIPINIVGTATDNDLRNLKITVYNITEGGTIYTKNVEIKGTGESVNYKYLAYTGGKVIDCLLVASINDGAKNVDTDSVKFKVY